MTSTIDKIRAEIERQQKSLENATGDFSDGRRFEQKHALFFLDTLQEADRPEPYNPVYDEEYLNKKIAKATESWKGVDVDAMLAESRGIEQEPQGLDEASEKYRRDSCNAAMMPNIDGPMPEYGGSVKDAFKAGATWREQQILKLSDNLDEAANEFANQDCVTFISRKKGFIAGAEWMAGQGVTFNAAVDYDEGFYIDSEEQETKAIEKLGLKVMDWVIVQIRKK